MGAQVVGAPAKKLWAYVPLLVLLRTLWTQMSRGTLGRDLRVRVRRNPEKVGQGSQNVTRVMERETPCPDAEKPP